MSRIITDLEHGAVVLIHDLTEPPVPGESVPQEVLGAVGNVAEKLGLDATQLAPAHVGWLFGLVGHVVEALSNSQGGAGAAVTSPVDVSTHEAVAGASVAQGAPETEAVAPSGGETEAVAGETEAVASSGGETEVSAPTPPATEHTPAIDEVIAKAQADFGGGASAA